MVALLATVFSVLLLHTRDVVRSSVIENLEAGQQLLALFESQRQREANLQASVLSETPTLKAALDTYLAEASLAGDEIGEQAFATLQREVARLAAFLSVDAVAVADTDGRVLASAGPAAGAWAPSQRLQPQQHAAADQAVDVVVSLGDERFRVTEAPIWLARAISARPAAPAPWRLRAALIRTNTAASSPRPMMS